MPSQNGATVFIIWSRSRSLWANGKQDADAEIEAVEDDVERDRGADDRRPDHRKPPFHGSVLRYRYDPIASRAASAAEASGRLGDALRRLDRAALRALRDQAVDVVDAHREHDRRRRRRTARASLRSGPPSTGEIASAVRRMPSAIHGWRPLSVTTQPAMMATKPSHQPCDTGPGTSAARTAGRATTRARRSSPIKIRISPMPTMMRKAKNTGIDRRPIPRRNALQARKQAVRIVREDERRCRLRDRNLEAVRLRLARPARRTARGRPACEPSQCASMAAILIGWCSSVLRPCWSPMKSCSGASTAPCRAPCASWCALRRRCGRRADSGRRPPSRRSRWSDRRP